LTPPLIWRLEDSEKGEQPEEEEEAEAHRAGYEVLEFRSENCSLEGRVGKTAEITFKEPVGNMLKLTCSLAWDNW
jgi:hypothetical protein